MAEKEWIEIGRVVGDTGPKGDTGDIGIGTVIKGHYTTYEEFVNVHPTGEVGDAYIVDSSYYYWDGTGWANAGSIKGEKGDTGDKGVKGDAGATGKAFEFSDFTPEQLASLKGATGDKGGTGNTGSKCDAGTKGDTGATGNTGAKCDTGPKGDTGQGSDEEAGWKLPVNQILTTTTLPNGISAGYRVAIVTNSVMAIKEYDGSSWKTESLDPYSVIPLKHSGGIQMYLAKSTGPVYMGVEYGVFGKFRFMTQSAYDALSSYDSDTIYFVRSS